MTYDHSWSENAAYCAEWRYWQAKARALQWPSESPGEPDAIAFWDRSVDCWGALLDLAFAWDASAQERAIKWGLENHWVYVAD